MNTLDYPGAVSMGFLAQFLRANRGGNSSRTPNWSRLPSAILRGAAGKRMLSTRVGAGG